jgi:hypothetical protein
LEATKIRKILIHAAGSPEEKYVKPDIVNEQVKEEVCCHYHEETPAIDEHQAEQQQGGKRV